MPVFDQISQGLKTALTILCIFSFCMAKSQSPKIKLNKSDTGFLNIYTPYIDDGATAFDSVDGDLTASIIVTTTVDTAKLGWYFTKYYVENSRGLADSVIRPVQVGDRISPVIGRKAGPIIRSQINDRLDMLKFVAISDNYSDSVFLYKNLDTIRDNIDIYEEGIYYFTVRAKDSLANFSDSLQFIVVIDYFFGLEDYENPGLIIFPNPNQGLVNIRSSNLTDASINVYRANGQLIYHKENIKTAVHQFELNERPGVYFIELNAKGVKHHARMILE